MIDGPFSFQASTSALKVKIEKAQEERLFSLSIFIRCHERVNKLGLTNDYHILALIHVSIMRSSRVSRVAFSNMHGRPRNGLFGDFPCTVESGAIIVGLPVRDVVGGGLNMQGEEGTSH